MTTPASQPAKVIMWFDHFTLHYVDAYNNTSTTVTARLEASEAKDHAAAVKKFREMGYDAS